MTALYSRAGARSWGAARLHAAPVFLLVLGLFYYWFAVADRYAVFLYGHSARGIPEATPFDEMTGSRYWMSGLVASGIVMVLYAGVNWLLGRVAARRHREYCPPDWWRVWVFCVPVLVIGIPLITMMFNNPTLPFSDATACVVGAVVGLAFALMPASWAVQRPLDLVWLALDGAGLMPTLLLLRAVELPGRGLSISILLAYSVALGGIFAGAVWLGVMTGLRAWRHRPLTGARQIFAAGLCLSYLLMPLVHHIFATPPGFRYISTASNFFAFSPVLQLMVFLLAGGLSVGGAWLRQRLV